MTGIALPIDALAGNPAFSAAQHRIANSVFMAPLSGRPLSGRPGLRAGAEPVVTVSTAGGWAVTPFACVVDAGTGLAVGTYQVAFPANETGPINAAHGSSQRLDRLSILVPDDPVPVGGARVASIVYTAGVAGSGVAPAVPARSANLGVITVPVSGGGAPTFAAGWQFISSPGGRQIVRNLAERDALVAYNGLHVHRLDTGRVDSYHNGWRTELDRSGKSQYSVAWGTTGGGTCTVGTGGKIEGWWKEGADGFIDWEIVLQTGANAVTPAGTMHWSLPVPAAIRSGLLTPVGDSIFVGGANVYGKCLAETASSAGFFQVAYHGHTGNAGAGATNNPAAWQSRSLITFSGRYEPA